MQYDKAKDFRPFRYLAPEKAPASGFFGRTTFIKTEDVLIGTNTCEFVFTVGELNDMDRGTVIFRAKDNGGAISPKKCSINGLKMVITLERNVVQFGKVQVEWATKPDLYSY